MGNLFYKKKPVKRKNIEIREDSPVRKRFRSTFDYLYKKFFIEGEGSDVIITAFDKSWKLHKLYISQSPFFSSMFSGSWLEKDLKEIKLDFADNNITSDALDKVFGSFYYDSLELKEDNVTNVIAASIWFQLDDLRDICEEFVSGILCLNNIVSFYELSILYGMPKLSEKCVEWFSCVILQITDSKELFDILRSISSKFMLEILSNPKLFVIQIEQDVFILLLKWLYFRLFPNIDPRTQDFSEVVCNYFKIENPSLSDINESTDVIHSLFEAVRWEHMISTSVTASALAKFSIIPKDILMSVYKNQWILMLKSNEAKSSGPPVDLNAETFWKYSERCGRTIINDVSTTWRWSTYKYDIDIVVRYINREFYIIRFIDQHNFFNWVRHVPEKRKLKLHLTIAHYQLDDCGHYPRIFDIFHSGLISLELLENLPVKVLSLPSKFQFPIILSANFLRFDPLCVELLESNVSLSHNSNFDSSINSVLSM